VVLGVLFEPDVDVGGEPQPDHFGPHQCHVAVDDAGLLQPLHAPQHRAGRQPDLLADHVVGLAAVRLQSAQDGPVELVECGGIGHRAILLSKGVFSSLGPPEN
jgi:hypothetical protein